MKQPTLNYITAKWVNPCTPASQIHEFLTKLLPDCWQWSNSSQQLAQS